MTRNLLFTNERGVPREILKAAAGESKMTSSGSAQAALVVFCSHYSRKVPSSLAKAAAPERASGGQIPVAFSCFSC